MPCFIFINLTLCTSKQMIDFKARPRNCNHAPFDRIHAVGPKQLDQLLPQKATETTSFCKHLSISKDFNLDFVTHNPSLRSAKILTNRYLLYFTHKNIKLWTVPLCLSQLFYSYLFEFSNRFNTRTKDQYKTFLDYFNQVIGYSC